MVPESVDNVDRQVTFGGVRSGSQAHRLRPFRVAVSDQDLLVAELQLLSDDLFVP